MNTRPSKEYRYIFTMTWKQASTSHLSSPLTDNASGKLFIIFILSYLFVLPISILRIPKTHNRISLQVWHTNILYFCSFCKPTFSGVTHEWDALYFRSVVFNLGYAKTSNGVCNNTLHQSKWNTGTDWTMNLLWSSHSHFVLNTLHPLVLQCSRQTNKSKTIHEFSISIHLGLHSY
jgi:hypothetical protein